VTCAACLATASNPRAGRYNFACVQCCARLVASTHPSKHQAHVMLAAVARFPASPSRQAILSCVARIQTKPPSASQKSGTPAASG